MNCPHCAVELRMTERKNIEIDYCPKCRGVWLDRGELDKMLESSERDSSDYDSYRPRSKEQTAREHADRDHLAGHNKGHPHKRKSFLSEIFDFD